MRNQEPKVHRLYKSATMGLTYLECGRRAVDAEFTIEDANVTCGSCLRTMRTSPRYKGFSRPLRPRWAK